jgi:hypothetical protein
LVFTLLAMRSEVCASDRFHAMYASTCTATATLLLIISLVPGCRTITVTMLVADRREVKGAALGGALTLAFRRDCIAS